MKRSHRSIEASVWEITNAMQQNRFVPKVVLILSGILLCGAFGWGIVSVVRMDKNPLGEVESYRDYLIGRHIALYGERPLLGPHTSIFGNSVPHSPAYFYYLAGIEALHDDLSSIKIAYVLVYLFGVVSLFLLARELFGNKTGLIASALYAVNYPIIFGFANPSATTAAPPFVVFSLFLLARAWRRGRFSYVVISIVVMAIAWSLYTGGVSLMAPAYIALIVLVLRLQKAGTKQWLWACFAGIGCGLIFYLPVIIYSHIADAGAVSVIADANKYASFGAFWTNIKHGLSLLIQSPFSQRIVPHQVQGFAYFIVVIGLTAYSTLASRNERGLIGLVCLCALVPVVSLSFFNMELYPYHLSAAFPLLFILAAAPIGKMFTIEKYSIAGVGALTALLFASASFVAASPAYSISSAVASINASIREIMTSESRTRADFFKVEFYRHSSQFNNAGPEWRRFTPALFVYHLERVLKERLVSADYRKQVQSEDTYFERYFDFVPVTSSNFFVLACEDSVRGDDGCIEAFKKDRLGYDLSKKIYSDTKISVFLFKRK